MDLLVRAALYFIIYSVVGYVWEIVCCSLIERKFTNRGFLFGPYLPLWGSGAVLLLAAQQWLKCTEWWQLFLMSVVVCDTIEYLTSYLMEKIYHLRWWDYTDSTRLSLNGRISLETSLGFGFGGLFLLSVLQPIIHRGVTWVPFPLQVILAVVGVAGMIVDACFSSAAAKQVEVELGTSGKTPKVDLTTEIKTFAKIYYSRRVRTAKKTRKSKKNMVKKLKQSRKQLKRQIKQMKKQLKKPAKK